MQYRLIKRYLEELTASRHWWWLRDTRWGFQLIIRSLARHHHQRLMVGFFDDQENWHRAMALGVSNYGQMTAGGWMYIGPRASCHGTYSTILNAGRAKLGIPADQTLRVGCS